MNFSGNCDFCGTFDSQSLFPCRAVDLDNCKVNRDDYQVVKATDQFNMAIVRYRTDLNVLIYDLNVLI